VSGAAASDEATLLGQSKTLREDGVANRIVMWDEATDEFADFVDELNEAMAAVFAGRECPRVTVVDTGTDMFAVVVSSGDITDAAAQKVWDDANAEVGR
jgi:hypothetical protein